MLKIIGFCGKIRVEKMGKGKRKYEKSQKPEVQDTVKQIEESKGQGKEIETTGQYAVKDMIIEETTNKTEVVVMAAEVESKTESITEPEEVKDTVAIKTTEEAETTAEGMVTIIGESKKLNVPSITGALHVEGTKLMGSNGEEVQLRGISTHGIAWFPDYINEECFRQLRNEWNVNVVRLALYTAEYNGYCTGGDREYLKNLIRNGVNYAKEQDMYVIVDWHILSDSNPNIYLNEAKEFFQEISAEYADSSHIIYEICNEPNGGTTWQDIKSYAKEVIGVIRANDEDAVILVGTPNWSQYVDQAAADPITEYNNLMYTLHFYATTHTDDLRNKMVSAIESGLPIFVSEYGICDASGSGAINEEQANLWVEQMDNYGISYVAWNMSNKNETSAIIQNWCNKTNNFSLEELSAAGQWLYKTLTKN